MRMRKILLAGSALLALGAGALGAQENPEVSVGVDLVSRYVWRGLNVGDAPSLQPSIALGFSGLELGAWGAYSLSNQITAGDEIDLWIGYNHEMDGGGSWGFLLTDYYFPNAGKAFSNFDNYDAEDGPGAHTLELGGTFTFSAVPLTLAGYVNVYNDEGHNIYVQADYPFSVGETSLNLFAGLTPGSEENPDYYGSDGFTFLNLGLTAGKEIPLTDGLSLPLSVSWILNPNLDITYLVVGISL